MPRFRRRRLGSGGPALAQRRVAIVSSAGLVVRGETPFRGRDADYRVIPSSTRPDQLLLSHISINLDRTGFQEDWNVVFPLDRLNELAAERDDRLGGGDPLLVYGRDRPDADGALRPRGRRSAEARPGRRRHPLSGLTALHARRERAGALSRGRGHRDGRRSASSGRRPRTPGRRVRCGSRSSWGARSARRVSRRSRSACILAALRLLERDAGRSSSRISRMTIRGSARPRLATRRVRQGAARDRHGDAAGERAGGRDPAARETRTDDAIAQRGRTTVGLSGLSITEAGRYIARWLRGMTPNSPSPRDVGAAGAALRGRRS